MRKLTGEIKIIQDSSGADYLAMAVDKNCVKDFVDFLGININPEYLEKQRNRDSNEYHVTILNVIQVGSFKKHKPEQFEAMVEEFKQQEPVFYAHGIGKVQGTKKQYKEDIENGLEPITTEAYFIVLQNDKISELRTKHFPDWSHQNLHCTLAFKEQDVHGKGVDKGVASLVYKNEEIPKNNGTSFKIK